MERLYCEYMCGNCIGVFGFEILLAQRRWWGCKLHGRDIWREDIVVPYVTTYAVTLRLRLRICVIGKHFGVKCICVGIFGLIFYRHSVVVCVNTYFTYTKMGGAM